VSTIGPKNTIYVDYPTPPSHLVEVKVAASEPVNIFAMRPHELKTYIEKRPETPDAIGYSMLEANHRVNVQLPPIDKWFLVIENPWNKDIEVAYEVSGLAPVLGGELASYSFSPSINRYETSGPTGVFRGGRTGTLGGPTGTMGGRTGTVRRR
jgi:hypothetical protein